jgi:peptidoglycan/LPS O-acetylase OafA/YrhL
MIVRNEKTTSGTSWFEGFWSRLCADAPVSAAGARDNNGNFVRFALAFSILIFHCLERLHVVGGMPFPFVACFLTLSGYLILKSLENSRSAGHFLWKRAVRIWPPMIVAFGLFALFSPAGFGFMIRHTFFVGGPGGASYWTISLEEILYLILVISFVLRGYKTIAGPIVGLAFTLAVHFVFYHPKTVGPMGYLENLLPMFFVGNLLHMLKPRWSWAIGAPLVVLFGVFALTGIGGAWNEVLKEMALAYPIVLFSFHTQGFFKWFDRMGDCSYSLFLYHVAFIDGLTLVFKTPLSLCVAVAVPGLMLSYASWWLMEKPILKLKNWRPLWLVRYGELRALGSHYGDGVRIEPVV